MPRPTLRTPRLTLEPLTLADLPILRTLDGDAEVLRYILGRARTPEEVERFWTPIVRDQPDGRLGMWLGSADGSAVGWWSLWPREGVPGEAEAGWRLLRRAWGRGLAREGARAVFEWGFSGAELTRIVAETMTVNSRSRAVMEALGMRHVSTEIRRWSDPLPGAEQGEARYEIT